MMWKIRICFSKIISIQFWNLFAVYAFDRQSNNDFAEYTLKIEQNMYD